MMKLLVTGNGFDLAHGLPVKYTDILDALFDHSQYESNHPNYPLAWLSDEIQAKYSDLELFNFYNSRRHLNGWAGFENTLQDILDFFISNSPHPILDPYMKTTQEENIYLPYNELASLILLHSKYDRSKLWDNLSNQLNSICEFIDLYLENIQAIPTTLTSEQEKSLLPIYNQNYTLYLTFNYTNTYSRYISHIPTISTKPNYPTFFRPQYGKQNEKLNAVHFIHGRSGAKNNLNISPFVLCVHNDIGTIDISDSDQIQRMVFEKSFQRLQKHTGNTYRQWFTLSIKAPQSVAHCETDIFGHSLDVADNDVIRFIINHSTKTTIFYLNQTDYENKIINLVKMYGSMTEVENLFYSGKITFKPIPT